jgi:hypothetical protein
MIAAITRRRRFMCSRVRMFIAPLYLGSGSVYDSAPLARTRSILCDLRNSWKTVTAEYREENRAQA